MATVDLILMRLATFEVLFAVEPTPKQVVLDEAVEIARKYSTTESGAFVNGVLDQLFKSKV
jgi:N utilization substance protein B